MGSKENEVMCEKRLSRRKGNADPGALSGEELSPWNVEWKSRSQHGVLVRRMDRALDHEPTPDGCSGASLYTDD